LKTKDHSAPQCAAFYLALLIGTAPTTSVTVAQKSYFVLNGATRMQWDGAMKTMSAREAKNGFGLMIDTARAEPVLIEKHGRGVVVVVAVEEYERLTVRLDSHGKTVRQAMEAPRK
jgi:prevent-host-death family protein